VLLLESEREARAEAEARRREIAEVMESRSRLMRGFSHDVKNPLGAADGYAALLEEGVHGELPPAQQAVVGRIRRSIRNALALIDDLHELAARRGGAHRARLRAGGRGRRGARAGGGLPRERRREGA
jgi:signal transduction histidine kinase